MFEHLPLSKRPNIYDTFGEKEMCLSLLIVLSQKEKKRKKKGMAVQDKATGLYKFLLVLTVHLG